MGEKNRSSKQNNTKSVEDIEIEYFSGEEEKPGGKYTVKKEEEEQEEEEKKDEAKAVREKLKKRETENKRLKKEFKKLNEEYLRSIADRENLRKRIEREKKDYFQYALSEILKDLLDVLDNFERALGERTQEDSSSYREGIEMIYKQFQDALKKQGIKPIEIEGNKFDPRIHQAFLTEESDSVQQAEISDVLQQGYMLHERLLRPVLVKVRIPKKKN